MTNRPVGQPPSRWHSRPIPLIFLHHNVYETLWHSIHFQNTPWSNWQGVGISVVLKLFIYRNNICFHFLFVWHIFTQNTLTKIPVPHVHKDKYLWLALVIQSFQCQCRPTVQHTAQCPKDDTLNSWYTAHLAYCTVSTHNQFLLNKATNTNLCIYLYCTCTGPMILLSQS